MEMTKKKRVHTKGNPMDRGAWRAKSMGLQESGTTLPLNKTTHKVEYCVCVHVCSVVSDSLRPHGL